MGSAFQTRLQLLGIPVDFETNAKAVLVALGEGRRSGLEPVSAAADDQIVTIPRLGLWLADGSDDVYAGPLAIRMPAAQQLTIEGPGFSGQADGDSFTANCTLTLAALESARLFHETIVATLALFLVTRLDRQPLHAAAVTKSHECVLLAGPSGTGKSTLSYAALSSGWTVLTDDAVYLQSQPLVRIWTRPSRLHVPPEAVRWFPELASKELILRDTGKWRIAVEAPRAEPVTLQRVRLCLVEASSGEPVCERIPVDDAIATLLQRMDAGFDVFRGTIGPVLRALLGDDGVFRLAMGSDPRRTVGLLDQLISNPREQHNPR